MSVGAAVHGQPLARLASSYEDRNQLGLIKPNQHWFAPDDDRHPCSHRDTLEAPARSCEHTILHEKGPGVAARANLFSMISDHRWVKSG